MDNECIHVLGDMQMQTTTTTMRVFACHCRCCARRGGYLIEHSYISPLQIQTNVKKMCRVDSLHENRQLDSWIGA